MRHEILSYGREWYGSAPVLMGRMCTGGAGS